MIKTQTATDEGLALTGYFDWVRNGSAAGREIVAGDWATESGLLRLGGSEMVDPIGNIVTGDYEAIYYPMTDSIEDGIWPGGITAFGQPLAPIPAQSECKVRSMDR